MNPNTPSDAKVSRILRDVTGWVRVMSVGVGRGWGERFGSRTIMHVDMDAFFAQIEVMDHPEYAGKPVIVGARPGERGVVSTCSYEARKFGVHSAMPIAQAVKLCPHAVFVAPRMSRYEEVSARIRNLLDDFSPLVEPISIDEAFLDMTGCEHFYKSPEHMGAELKRSILEATGLTASVGVAPNKFLAKLASDQKKPNGLFVIPLARVDSFLLTLPVRKLWGVGPKTAERLARRGIRSVADVRRAGLELLVRELGPAGGHHLFELAHGRDSRPVEPETEAKSIGREVTFAQDLPDGPELRTELARIVSNVGWRLRRSGLFARTVTVKVRFANFETHTKSKTLSQAFHDDDTLYRVSAQLLDAFALRRPLRLLGVYTSHLEERTQPSLFDSPERDRLTEVMDDLNRKLGRRVVRRGREL